MQFGQRLRVGTLVKRYQRFLADVRLGGELITAHVANTGSMRGCAEPGSRVALSHHPDAGRKLPWSWELVDVAGAWVGINTGRANRIVEEAVSSGRIGPLRGYPVLRREVRYGTNSRIDLLLEGKGPSCYVEVKNVTLREGRRAIFPDSVTERGTKHLRELREMVRQGHRSVMLFLVNRPDCGSFAPADAIDPLYGRTLREAAAAGVELLAYRAETALQGISIQKKLPIHLGASIVQDASQEG